MGRFRVIHYSPIHNKPNYSTGFRPQLEKYNIFFSLKMETLYAGVAQQC
jgi:hypothetical protein